MDRNNMPGQEESVYRTGSTRPPKNYGGIIAVLLVIVIFLCGINGMLGLMNIRLLEKLQQSEEPTANTGVNFAHEQSTQSLTEDAQCIQLPFGMQGCILSGFDQMLYELPEGIYITSVTPDCDADRLGVRPGDVLVRLNDQALTDTQTLTDALNPLHAGQTVQAEFNRDGEIILLELTVE